MSREFDNRFKRFFLKRKPGTLTPWEVDASGKPSVLVRSLVFFGILCIMSGGWCFSEAVVPFLCTGELKKYQVPSILLLFDSAMLLAVGIFTICASHAMLRLVLIALCQILYVCLVLESVAGALAIALDTTARGEAFHDALLRNAGRRYGLKPRESFAIDRMQVAFNCCGVDGPSDWNDTRWARNALMGVPTTHLPLSCCGENADRCYHPSRRKGCLQSARRKMRRHLQSVSLCALCCVFLHLTMCLVGVFLEGVA